MLLDLKLQDLDGKVLIERLNQAETGPPFIIITGQGDERVAGGRDEARGDGTIRSGRGFLAVCAGGREGALAQLDQQRRLAEAEEQVHLVRSAIDQGFSAVLITTADLPDPRVV